MKRQSQSYPSLLTLTGVVFALTGVGCGARETSATDTKTNWLLSCDEDSDCNSSLACLCGVCSSTCDTKSDCTNFDGDARCFDVSHCGSVAAVCALSEEDLNPMGNGTDREAGTTSPSTSATSSAGEPTGTETADGTTTNGTDSTASCRDESFYVALGETCQVIDFDCAEDEVMFSDDCGCGCEANPACEADREYLVFGETCNLVDIQCEAGEDYFLDDCGCGCTPNPECDPDITYLAYGEQCLTAPECDAGELLITDDCGCYCAVDSRPIECQDPNRTYLSTDVEYCQLAEPNCGAGTTQFSDACGCGCEVNDVDGGPADFCPPPPPEGTSIQVTVLAETTCFGDMLSQLVTSREDLDTALAYCGIVIDEVSFEGNVVYIGVFPERTSARFNYAVQTSGNIHVGLESDAYCGGAAPPDAVVVLQLNGTDGNTPVIEDLCTLGECTGLPVP